MSNFCASKFKKSDLNGKMVAFHLPPENLGVIGKMEVEENQKGEVSIVIDYGFMNGGQIIAGKLAIGQDWIEKLIRNSDKNIPAEFYIPKMV